MRRLILAFVLAGLATETFAADPPAIPTLRGSDAVVPAVSPAIPIAGPAYPDWSGVYVGVQAGQSTASMDFANGTSTLIHFILRNTVIENQVAGWTTLGQGDTVGRSYGGFIGYNTNWDEVVLGVEANYNKLSASQSASDALSRVINNSPDAPLGHTYAYDVSVSSSSAVHITDLLTLRARAGWAAGQFLLPYAFAGLAVGRADVTRSASVSGTLTDDFFVNTPFPDGLGGVVVVPVSKTVTSFLVLPGPQGESFKGVFAYGYTAGLGVDVALMRSLFLRAEWEWIQFAPIKDTRVHINTARVAVGFKF
ncbi:MAG: outer rane immunogenic protein [Alphaproteobacteria bacterium]|jgi:opacity protein-like surface antigen|nr:outer rane immunogenic protein [Alphaproteobacteria bacterium]